ncbi:putative pectinesterase 52 [Spatholobus suberectus]|nr:putative pectinesterase 52 [Spatholobus suberectus]
MANRCLVFAMLVVAGIVVLANLPAGISAQTECGGDFSSIITKCNSFVQREGPEIPPSQDCCNVVKNVDVPCLCKYVTPEIEAQISLEKTIYVARTCGCSVPEGTKCGNSLDCGGKNIAYTITVGRYGKVTFRTIQAAIDSIRSNNGRWVRIHIKAGLYIEGRGGSAEWELRRSSENCLINAVGGNRSSPGYVIAQGRNSSNDPSGFVFKGGSLTGNGKVNLGRAWRLYSRVIFHGTNFSFVVTPQGWNAWIYVGQESKFTYAEVDCKGPGADTLKRVTWMKKLNHSQLEEFSLASFINKDRWLDNLPTIS